MEWPTTATAAATAATAAEVFFKFEAAIDDLID